jgi:Ca2+:H+ antiporter
MQSEMQALSARSDCSVGLPSKEADDVQLLSHQQDSSYVDELNPGAAPSLQTVPKRRTQLQHCIEGFKNILMGSKVNYLLIVLPVALASGWFNSSLASFFLCLIALIPLANLMGEATDELAEYTSQTIGGLLVSTFGNAVELIVAIVALKNGQLRIVQTSLLGSLLSNSLLVLGDSFLAAGWKFHASKFNAKAARITSALLLMGIISIIMPCVIKSSMPSSTPAEISALDANVLRVSRMMAIVLFLGYGCYLTFQLKTHTELFADDEGDDKTRDGEAAEGVVEEGAAKEDGGEEGPQLPFIAAIFLLLFITVTAPCTLRFSHAHLDIP